MERCLEMGMQDYVTKPIDVDQLYEVTTKWIANKDSINKNNADETNAYNFSGINVKNGP